MIVETQFFVKQRANLAQGECGMILFCDILVFKIEFSTHHKKILSN